MRMWALQILIGRARSTQVKEDRSFVDVHKNGVKMQRFAGESFYDTMGF